MSFARLWRNGAFALAVAGLLVLGRLYLPGPWPWRHRPPAPPAVPADGRFYAGVDSSRGGLARYDKAAGLSQPAVFGVYTNGRDGDIATALGYTDALPGTIPMLSWGVDFTGGAVVDGSEDTYLRTQADAVASYGKPVFLRLDWEMNGSWYPEWGSLTVSSATYVEAWKHIWTLFQQAGATNAAFVWCPNVGDMGGRSWTEWYPGDDYVDWVGLDVYPEPSDAAADVSGPGGLDELAAFAEREGKPAMLAEWAPGAPKQDPAGAFDLVFSWLDRNPGTAKAMLYFNYSSTQRDDLLADNPDGAARYRTLLHAHSADLAGAGELD